MVSADEQVGLRVAYDCRMSLMRLASICASSLGGPDRNRDEESAGSSMLGTASHRLQR